MIAPRRRSARGRLVLDEPERFERLLGDLCSQLVAASAESIDDAIRHWLSELRERFRVDGAALVQLSAHTPRLHVTQINDRRTGSHLADSYDIQEFGACVAAISQGDVVLLRQIADLGTAGAADRTTLEAAGVAALLATPLAVGGQPLGFLALMSAEARDWQEEEVSRLRVVGGMIATTLLRRNSERSLRSSDALSGAVLASLSAKVAVLDRAGRILRVNQAWRGAPTVIGGGAADVGDNYLDACRAAMAHDPAADVVRGLEAVLAGDGATEYRAEYGSAPGNGWRWHELVIEPLRVPQGGAVVMLTDATARKRAELEAEAHRSEAAHAARGATLGELAAGLAHELNQPLAAILTNVQASQRVLASEPLRTELLRDILNDIAADDVRAAEIIRRMRALLKKGQRDVQPLDLSQLANDVLRLVASDAILRRVRIHPRLDPDLPGIVGDRVQLQQVILNLVVNGLESMSATPTGHRHLTIHTRHPDSGDWVEVTVQDTGPGISAELLGRIYEPFFSTKPDGLGMGLSICRSIAEAHGGRLEATNNPGGGATFVFALPVAGTLADTHSPRQEQRAYVEHGADRLRR